MGELHVGGFATLCFAGNKKKNIQAIYESQRQDSSSSNKFSIDLFTTTI